jgi:hypothetical protein
MGWLGCIVDEDDPRNYEKWKPRKVFLDKRSANAWVREKPYQRNIKEIDVVKPHKCLFCHQK